MVAIVRVVAMMAGCSVSVITSARCCVAIGRASVMSGGVAVTHAVYACALRTRARHEALIAKRVVVTISRTVKGVVKGRCTCSQCHHHGDEYE